MDDADALFAPPAQRAAWRPNAGAPAGAAPAPQPVPSGPGAGGSTGVQSPGVVLPQNFYQAQAFYGDVLAKLLAKGPEHDREGKRWLCRNDLFFLLWWGLGRVDVLHPWLFARIREVEAAPNGRLDLWARGHFKSTIITFAKTIQDILVDPNLTFGIFSDVNKVAKPFLKQIKRELESNQRLKSHFPDILYDRPEVESPQWNETDGIIVRRTANKKEATVEAYGLVDGQPIGRHFDRLIFDDVVTPETVGTPDSRAKVLERVQLASNLGSTKYEMRFIGTRYHVADAYQWIIDNNVAQAVRTYPATHNGRPDGDPVFLTREALAQKRKEMGPFVFGAQMLMNPLADSIAGFDREWIRWWPGKVRDNLNIYILVDPSSGKRQNDNKLDFTSMWVIGAGPDGKIYVLDHVRDRLNLPQRIRALFELVLEYKPIRVGYESYGLQADVSAMEMEQERKNFRFDIVELGGRLEKRRRILKMVPWFEQGKILLPAHLPQKIDSMGRAYNPIQKFIAEEYGIYPLVEHDDGLDGLARFLDDDLGLEFPDSMETQAVIAARDGYSQDDEDVITIGAGGGGSHSWLGA